MKNIILIFYFYNIIYGFEDDLIGCFKDMPKNRSIYLAEIQGEEDCMNTCFKRYYRFFSFYKGHCSCGNFLGEQLTNTTCDSYCKNNQCDALTQLTNVYTTANMVPGPPRDLKIINITSNSMRVYWKEPESYVEITGYEVRVEPVKTFSHYPIQPMEWSYGNGTFQSEISTLLSATKYNISIYSIYSEGKGASVNKLIETRLAEPDNLPPQPEILSNEGDKIKVRLTGTTNNNGPITAYRIIVVKSDDNQAFDKDSILSFSEAQKNGLSYYIAAEIKPNDIERDFIVGDGRRYGSFYNAPLDPSINYDILLGLVSYFNGETKVAYSQASGYRNGISILNVYDGNSQGDSPGVIIGLSVAIGFLTFMFITGIIGFLILKSKIVNRRQRLSDNQELTLQGPMIEVENNGYIHEEDHISAVSHYRNLKQKVRTLSPSQLKIEPTNLLGVGKFGKVNSGTLHESDILTTVTCYSIYDKKMNQETKKSMLQELDVLIKTGKHENLINLIGTSETREMVVVVMEYASMNLKDFLLGSRDHFPGKFSSMTEKQALDIALGICKGMGHLHNSNIIHKQLCARSILITNDLVPKVASYGLAQYFSHNKIPDYTRWTAMEVFKGNQHTMKSDIWSFACLLWEIVALGGTPYGNISSNNEVPANLSKGIRLPQLSYVNDDLYQIMLDCWQLVPDERPKFEDLLESLESLRGSNLVHSLSFSIFSNFQYEQFYPDMELSVRPVF
ncbi:putative tyrosine-protein kinase Wsck [Sitophilus oryzae]|uniref:Tyrosine-protein kinase Wsck n=1 Tax=Sitophilus oryzae TaxID=7048 RepID=A0A6J2XZW5_SITOR|nr:putative tyrosine-protein kinase Wsck [Sitophilus oryzae]XP_030756310.1 putative tyrosine-protein kinase Wsck [Sitophilus oryzae]XP_030756311.1 putative tyrosine-protein kinase Wsck [Sitophilus oryzae]